MSARDLMATMLAPFAAPVTAVVVPRSFIEQLRDEVEDLTRRNEQLTLELARRTAAREEGGTPMKPCEKCGAEGVHRVDGAACLQRQLLNAKVVNEVLEARLERCVSVAIRVKDLLVEALRAIREAV